MTTGYVETYRRASNGRRNSGRRPPRRSTGNAAGIGCSMRAGRPSIGGSRAHGSTPAGHVAAGRGKHVALIWDSPVTGRIERFTYRELRDEVARLAACRTGV